MINSENRSAEISWLDRSIKRFKTIGTFIPETQREIYVKIAETWAVDKTVVDVGCSIGVGADILSGYAQEVWGVDINEEAIRFASALFRGTRLIFGILDIEDSQGRKLPIFDVIVAVELLEHLADYRAGLRTLKRFFAPDGHSIGVITVPNIDDEQVRLRDMANPLHLHRWTANEFQKLMDGEFESVRLYEDGTLLMAEVGNPK